MLTGGRVTAEDAYAYAKFARVSLQTHDIDFRARPHSAEEAAFLASHVALSSGVDYADLEAAPLVVLVGLEPEDEAATIFLRLRKASKKGTRVVSIAPYTSRGLAKMRGQLIADGPRCRGRRRSRRCPPAAGLGKDAIVLVGERLAGTHGALTALADLAARTGARLAWVPRRAGDRGAVESGALPNLLPGGRPVADAGARVDAAAAWGVDSLSAKAGRDGDSIVAALLKGELGGLVVGGVDPDDTSDPAAFRAALDAAGFVVSLELRETDVTRVADVVLPVSPVADKAGTFVTWEGRTRSFEAVFTNPASLPDLRVLAGIADELAALGQGAPLGFRTVSEVRSEMEALGPWDGARPALDAGKPPRPAKAARKPSRDGARHGARELEAARRPRVDAGRRAAPAGHRPARPSPASPTVVRRGARDAGRRPVSRPSHRHRRPRHRDPAAWRSPTCPTTSCGSRPAPSAGVSSPSSPHRAARCL